MPIKSPFKRSLLNVQPLPETKSPPPVTSLTENVTPDPLSGFDSTNIGFSTVITRQVPPTSESADSISLVGNGSNDSSLAMSVSTDPKRPELISLSAPFRVDRAALLEILRLRDFEASVDESDITHLYSRLTESEISKDIENRGITAESVRSELEATNSALMEIVAKIEKFRDNSDFLLNNHAIHRGSLKYLQNLPRKYGEDVNSVNPTFERTFLNMENAYRLSNTSLVTLLAYTLLYPGSVKFETVSTGNSDLDRFNVPSVKTDPVNQLLTSIAGVDVKSAEGYLAAESLLPQDPITRVALISEALSYELSLSAGAKRAGVDDILSYIQQSVGGTPNVITSSPAPGTVISSIRDSNSLLLETRDIAISGVQYSGVLTSLIDSSISSGTLDFTTLTTLTQVMSEKFSKLLQDTLGIRLLDDSEETLSPTGIIVRLAEAVRSGTSTIQKCLETGDISSSSRQQISQLLLLKELANSSGSTEILESRFRAFIDIVTQKSETATVEGSSAVSEERQVSTKTSARVGDKVKLSIKSNSLTDTIEIENLPTDTPAALNEVTEVANAAKPSITSATALSFAGGIRARSSLSSALQIATKAVSATESEKVAKIMVEAENEMIHSTFTGRGGSGHISSTYNTSFDMIGGSTSFSQNSSRKNDIFERYGLTLGVAGLLGVGEAARKSLAGEDINLTLRDLLEISVGSTASTHEELVTEIVNTVVQEINTQQSAQNDAVVEKDTETQKNKKKLDIVFGTIPFRYHKKNVSDSPQIRKPRRTSYSIAGMSTVMDRKRGINSVDKGGQIAPTPVKKRQQDLLTVKRDLNSQSRSSLRSENVYGLSNDRNGVRGYSDTISKISSSPSLLGRNSTQSVKKKIDSVIPKDNPDSVLDTVTMISKSSDKKVGVDPSLISKQIIPESKQAEVSTEFKSFLTLFPKVDTEAAQNTYSISMASIKGSLKSNSSSQDSLLSDTFRKFVNELLETAGNIAGDPETFASSTTNYGISRDVVEFLCYSMFISMCSCMHGVIGSGETKVGRQDFDVLVTPQLDLLVAQQNVILGISGYTGALSEFIMRFEGYPTDITIFNSLRYAEKVTETLKSRWSVMQSFLATYASAVASVTGLSSDKKVTETIAKIVAANRKDLLGELTYETVTNSQLITSKLRGPLKLDRRIRNYRTAKTSVPLFLAGFSSQTASDSSVACVGIPSKSLEFLRRRYQGGETISPPTGREYLEVVFTKQDFQFPDLVLRSSTYRFCPVLEVIIQPTFEKTIQAAMGDFLYLCHNGTEWEQKGLSGALDFVIGSTGLDEISSYIVIVNHAIDALCNITNFALGSFDMGETISKSQERVISKNSADVLLKMLKSSVGPMIPRGLMLPGDFLTQETGGYRFKRYSSLGPSVIKLTNESNHRLLGQILTDPIFTAENLYTLATCFTPFERTYNCVIDPDEFVIDKSQTLATSGGRAIFNLLVNQGAIDVYPEVAVFKEGTDAKILEGSVYATKVELVTT